MPVSVTLHVLLVPSTTKLHLLGSAIQTSKVAGFQLFFSKIKTVNCGFIKPLLLIVPWNKQGFHKKVYIAVSATVYKYGLLKIHNPQNIEAALPQKHHYRKTDFFMKGGSGSSKSLGLYINWDLILSFGKQNRISRRHHCEPRFIVMAECNHYFACDRTVSKDRQITKPDLSCC